MADATFAERNWKALSEPFVAPNGLRVETLTNSEDLFQLGVVMRNALSSPQFVDIWSERVAEGKEMIYQVMKDKAIQSCGELTIREGAVHLVWNRAFQNAPGSPESEAAVTAYVDAINDGEIDLNYTIGQYGFEPAGGLKP